MALTYVTYTGNGSQKVFTFNIPYLDPSHVKAQVGGVNTPCTISGSTVTLAVAPAIGAFLKILRQTPTTPLVEYSDGTTDTAAVKNIAALQTIYIAEENTDKTEDTINKDGGFWDAQGLRISNVGDAVSPDDAPSFHQINDGVEAASVSAAAAAGSATSASGFASLAQLWATSVSIVDGALYGARYYASTAQTYAATAAGAASDAFTYMQNALASVGALRITTADTTPSGLNNKLTTSGTSGLVKTVANSGGNETLGIAVNAASVADIIAGVTNKIPFANTVRDYLVGSQEWQLVSSADLSAGSAATVTLAGINDPGYDYRIRTRGLVPVGATQPSLEVFDPDTSGGVWVGNAAGVSWAQRSWSSNGQAIRVLSTNGKIALSDTGTTPRLNATDDVDITITIEAPYSTATIKRLEARVVYIDANGTLAESQTIGAITTGRISQVRLGTISGVNLRGGSTGTFAVLERRKRP